MQLKALILLALQASLVACTVGGYSLSSNIRRFDDEMLPSDQRNGQYIVGLGRLAKLDTILPPKRTEALGTKITVYSRQNSATGAEPIAFETEGTITFGDMHHYDLHAMSECGFDPKKRTIIMVAGYMTNDHVDWMEQAKELWLKLEDVNVILASWSGGNKFIYSQAVADTPLVARQITIFLHYLAQLSGFKLTDDEFTSKIHFIGHSLGAHIAGFVGQDLGARMGRITGLDPAGPSFDQLGSERRLDKSDARLVDVIHTNAGRMHYLRACVGTVEAAIDEVMCNLPFINKIASNDYDQQDQAWYGIDLKVGHVDYYANDGSRQPGCFSRMHKCDHVRAHDIYIDLLMAELNRRSSFSDDRLAGRPLAFKADNYDSFLSGKSLAERCPSLLDSQKGKNSGQISEELKRCSLPLDLVKPVDELIDELRNDYMVDFELDSADQLSYYFSTNYERPLIGHHNLLIVRLDKEATKWNSECSLKFEVKRDDVIKTSLNSSSQLLDSNQFYGIALPFTDPFNKGPIQTSQTSNPIGYREVPFPKQISLISVKPKGVRDEFKSLWGLLGGGGTGNMEDGFNCNLKVESIELVPSFELQRHISASYVKWNQLVHFGITKEYLEQVFHLDS